MRVLWVVNIVLPDAAHLVGEGKIAFGGWIGAMLNQLSRTPGIELGVVTRADVPARSSAYINGIQYYILPQSCRDKYDISSEDCRFVLDEFRPDLLHVEGTEFSHALTFLNSWQGKNVVSLQGIINGYEPYQYGGLPVGEMLFSFSSVKVMVAASLIYRKLALFMPRLKGEVNAIRKAQNILGRTTWDHAYAYAMNPDAPYYSCNRILRDEFYRQRWDIAVMERHSVFIGNAASALKGAHFALTAIAQLKREYPNIKLYIAGVSPFGSTRKVFTGLIGYPAYLRYLIRKLDIKANVVFTGVLQADEMATLLSRVNAFVLCSTIENSPNTLGEAMAMGVPCISSFVGGAADMAHDGEEALFYRDNDPVQLAFQIKRIFDDEGLALKLSSNARHRALDTHDPQDNVSKILRAYYEILGKR